MLTSAQAALSWVRSHADELSISEDYFQNHDLHVHVPAVAVPKDGPSAGVTRTTALASLIGKPVASNVAMTGEVTLSGKASVSKKSGRKNLLPGKKPPCRIYHTPGSKRHNRPAVFPLEEISL